MGCARHAFDLAQTTVIPTANRHRRAAPTINHQPLQPPTAAHLRVGLVDAADVDHHVGPRQHLGVARADDLGVAERGGLAELGWI
jgi:hypothetical protein